MIVGIPTIGGAGQLTYELVQDLLADPLVSEVRLYDNSRGKTGDMQLVDDRVRYIHQPGRTIYHAWNETLLLAHVRGLHALVLNDDVVIPEGLADHMVRALRMGTSIVGVDPDVGRPAVPEHVQMRKVRGSYRHGGITGHAFMCAPLYGLEILPLVHEGFQWWGGDDDLFFRYEQEGLALGRCIGLGVGHLAETTARQHAWTGVAAAADRVLLEELWGAGTGW